MTNRVFSKLIIRSVSADKNKGPTRKEFGIKPESNEVIHRVNVTQKMNQPIQKIMQGEGDYSDQKHRQTTNRLLSRRTKHKVE